MNILIDKVRVKNFRSLRDVEVSLNPVTLLVGANNAGKTTFLRALNTVLGANKTQINRDDLFIDQNGKQQTKSILIDLRIIPVNDEGKRSEEFNSQWGSIFGSDVQVDEIGDFFAFRTEIKFANEGDKYESFQYFLTDWKNPNPKESEKLTSPVFRAISLYFIDAQRDLNEDLKLRTSYFGKLATQIDNDYDENNLGEINKLVDELNTTAISKSKVLTHLQNKLSELNRTTYTSGKGVSISPFPKKVRDLHKGMKVDFQDSGSDSFSLEYHGMGTRSWASILSFSAFTSWETHVKTESAEAYFPILALEEPEAHLHPNAQRTLYRQLKNVGGQKIISTHSPYIASQAELEELRHFYKKEDCCSINQLMISLDEETQVGELLREIEQNGNSPEINKRNRPKINELLESKRQKLNTEDCRKIRREVMNTRGEILFAKAVILFEGETEEQALPVLAREYFSGNHPFELGLNFIGVGGKGKYQPFLNVAKFLNVPWYILSDGDGDTEQNVKSQIKGIFGEDYSCLFVFEDNSDFEEYLLKQGYKDELINAVNSIKGDKYFPNIYMQEQNGNNRKGGSLKEYLSDDGSIIVSQIEVALLDCMAEGKTEYAESIAVNILSKKDVTGKCIIPEKMLKLFEKIDLDLSLTKANSL